MTPRIRRFRQALSSTPHDRSGTRRRYSEALRQEAVAITRSAGQPVARTARALGIPVFTLHDWLRRTGPVLRPVAVHPRSEPASTAGLTLVTPSGFRIEGLDAAAAVQILKSFG